MKYKVFGIVYDTDGEKIDLPTEMVVECEDSMEIADAISDKTGWLVETFQYELIRDGYLFRDTFDAGLDPETLQCDIYGVDVYKEGTEELLGHVDWVGSDEIEEMDDDEFENFLIDNDII